jgi:hypothetical protein
MAFAAIHSEGQQAAEPPKLYVSEGACPFECCTYQDWIAKRTVTLLDRPGGSAIVQVRKGEKVQAITGEVRTHPLRYQIQQTEDNPQVGTIAAGSTVYLLHPIGEGFWLVWYRGKIVPIDPQYVGPDPSYQWWAKVKSQSGRIGWVQMKANDLAFDRVDRCA